MVAYDPVPIESMAKSLDVGQRKMAGVIGRAFAAAGYGPSIQAAAVANAYMESNLDPKRWGDWHKDERRYCSGGLFQLNRCGGAGIGMTETQIEDPKTNAERMVDELNGHFGRPVVKAYARGERRVGELSKLMCIHMLRPKNAEEKGELRANIAEALYPHLAIGTAGSATTIVNESFGAAAWLPDWTRGVEESDWPMIQQIMSLHPGLARKVEIILEQLRKLEWDPIVVSGWRSGMSQQKLYIDGHTARRFSFHNVLDSSGNPMSMAVDIVDKDYRYGRGNDPRSQGRILSLNDFQKAIEFFKDLARLTEEHGLIIGASERQQNLGLDTSWQHHGLHQDPSHLQMLPYADLPKYQDMTEKAYTTKNKDEKADAESRGKKFVSNQPPWSIPISVLRESILADRKARSPRPVAPTTPSHIERQTTLDIDGLYRIVPAEGYAPEAPKQEKKTPEEIWTEDSVQRSGEQPGGGGGALAMGLLGIGTALILLKRP